MSTECDKQYKTRWEERYRQPGYAYGKAPNIFFAAQLKEIQTGSILMPAEGEGRNGVYAAGLGWKVSAFDLSDAGRAKAMQLAAECGVSLSYEVGDLEQLIFTEASFDTLGIIYAHVAPAKKRAFLEKLGSYLKPRGTVIFEAFGKRHLQLKAVHPGIGGPDDIDMLFSAEELQLAFAGYEVLLCREEVVHLNEGQYHSGKGSVLRFVARKP